MPWKQRNNKAFKQEIMAEDEVVCSVLDQIDGMRSMSVEEIVGGKNH